MYYLTIGDVLEIHTDQNSEFGGAEGVRDKGVIEAALLRPQTGYYNDIIEEAAATWESLTMNHGFVDENKRVGLAVMEVFLEVNGIKHTANNENLLNFIYSNLEAGTFNKDNLDAWLRENTARR